jgi:hypothetical protein
MIESARIIPIMSSKISLTTVWDTASRDDDTKDDKSDHLKKLVQLYSHVQRDVTTYRCNLNDTENKLRLSIAFDTEEVDEDNNEPKDCNPGGTTSPRN